MALIELGKGIKKKNKNKKTVERESKQLEKTKSKQNPIGERLALSGIVIFRWI